MRANDVEPILAREFVPGKPFQPILMFACKAGAYPSEAPFYYKNP